MHNQNFQSVVIEKTVARKENTELIPNYIIQNSHRLDLFDIIQLFQHHVTTSMIVH